MHHRGHWLTLLLTVNLMVCLTALSTTIGRIIEDVVRSLSDEMDWSSQDVQFRRKRNSDSVTEGGSDPEGVTESEEGVAEPAMTEDVRVGLIIGYSLIIFLIVVGNILIAVVIMKDKTLRSNTSNFFLFSLVSARCMIGLLVVPARITGLFSEAYLGSILCKLCHFTARGSGCASVFSIMSIAITKYQSVIKNARPPSPMKSAMIMVLVWVAGFIYAIHAPIVNDLTTVNAGDEDFVSCTVDDEYRFISKYVILADILILFIAPFLVVAVCNTAVIRKLSKSEGKKDVRGQRNSLKAIHMLIVLMILFTVCTSAPMIINGYLLWGGSSFNGLLMLQDAVYMFSYSNAWFNIIVFLIFREDLRAGLRHLFKCNKATVSVSQADNTDRQEEPHREEMTDEPRSSMKMVMDF